jgi:hypothetical protein
MPIQKRQDDSDQAEYTMLPPNEEDVPQSLLAAYPPGAHVVDIQSFRPGYLPYPARVTVETSEGMQAHCVLHVDEDAEKTTRQAYVLLALNEFGLPVPTVLSGPVTFPRDGRSNAALLVSELPGKPLPWFDLKDLDEAHLTCQLVREAVDALHSVTTRIEDHEVSRILPRFTLFSELKVIRERTGPGLDLPLFQEALELLESIVPTITTPLVFSNGDYNPVNFLHVGPELTGLVDFEYACFEDPYIGFAKFFLWADDSGWWTGMKAGLVEKYLYAHHVAPFDFLPRLVLRGLRHLQESAIAAAEARPRNTFVPPEYMLTVIADAVARLKSPLKS